MPAITAAEPATSTAPATNRLPFVVVLLTIGTFLMNTTEFMIAGLLPEMAGDLGIGLTTAAALITAFAVGMVIGAPVMAVATLRVPRRVTLVAALAIFAAGHVLAALSETFEVVLAARVLTALVTGMFWAVAAVVATSAAGPANASRALGVLMSGTGLATVVGVPLGSFAGQVTGWRGSFWGLAVLSLLAAVLVARAVPADPDRAVPSIRAELRALRNAPVWLVLAGGVLVTGAWVAVFSYIAPLLTDGAGLSAGLVPLVLVGFGIGALVGTNLAGRLADARPVGTFIGAAVGNAVVLGLLALLAGVSVAAVVLLVLLGITGMAIPPVATGLAVSSARSAPTLAAALSVSAFNTGIAAGTWLSGMALDSALGTSGPAVVGTVGALLGLVPLLLLARTRRTADRTAH